MQCEIFHSDSPNLNDMSTLKVKIENETITKAYDFISSKMNVLHRQEQNCVYRVDDDDNAAARQQNTNKGNTLACYLYIYLYILHLLSVSIIFMFNNFVEN